MSPLFLDTPLPPSTSEHLTSPLFLSFLTQTMMPFILAVTTYNSTAVKLRNAISLSLFFCLV